MSVVEAIKRFAFMLVGVFVTAFGLAACVKAGLGISPITTLAYALHTVIPSVTLGTFTFMQHCLFFLLTVLLLRREFKPYQLLILPSSFLFGRFIDWSEILLAPLPTPNYFVQIVVLLVSCVIVGLGFSMIISSGVALDANTVFLNSLSMRTGKPYSNLKVLTDLIIVALAALVALIFLHTVVGIREGTVVAAVAIGPIVGFFNRYLCKIERFFVHGGQGSASPSPAQEDGANQR
ncbi:MAG: DUF6198 family protein [Oscillospiraceae bacterium]|nr:DUF6198 family protein [Oscillospiraceae bacterium]